MTDLDDEWDVWEDEEADEPLLDFTPQQGRGHASYWMDRFGGIQWSKSDDEADDTCYRDALKAVSRTANLVSNRNLSAGKDGERHIAVRWSDGEDNHRNSVEDDVIYLSPDLVSPKKRRGGWSDDQVVDVLIGSALTESAYKGLATYEAETKIVNNMGPDMQTGSIEGARAAERLWNELGRKMWFAAECIAAEESVLDTYPGFSGYYQTMRDYYTDPLAKTTLQDHLNETTDDPQVHLAVQAVIWNMIHRDDPLDLPKVYRKHVTNAVESMRRMRMSLGRARATINAQRVFNKYFRLEYDPPENPDTGPDGENRAAPSMTSLGMPVDHGGKVENNTGIKNLSDFDPSIEDEEPQEDHVIRVPDGDKYEEAVFNIVQPPSPGGYKHQRKTLQSLITGLKNRLKLRNEMCSYHERGLRRGCLDEGSLYKLGFYPHLDDPNIFERETILDKPDIAFMLLIDESGSMSGTIKGGRVRKDTIARQTAIVVAEALAATDGVKLAVMGHTAEEPKRNGLTLYHYLTPEQDELSRLAGIKARSNNADGYAIQVAAKRMLEWFPQAQTKVLIHVSDGLPRASKYGGATAQDHVHRVCNYYRQYGIRTVALGIDSNALSGEAMSQMYGEQNWALLADASHLPRVAANLISKTVQRESRF